MGNDALDSNSLRRIDNLSDHATVMIAPAKIQCASLEPHIHPSAVAEVLRLDIEPPDCSIFLSTHRGIL